MKKNRKVFRAAGIAFAAAAGAAVFGVADALYKTAFYREAPELPACFSDGSTHEPDAVDLKRRSLTEASESFLTAKEPIAMQLISEDGLRLFGRFLPAASTSVRSVILVHGFRSNPTVDFGGLIEYYHAQGFNVLLVDDRAHGASEGEEIGFGFRDRRDLVRWCRQLVTVTGDDARIALHGVSMGASAVMFAAGEDDLPEQVKCFIEDCGFSSVREEFAHTFPKALRLLKKPVLFAADLLCRGRNGYALSEASVRESLHRNRRPMLFIHGGQDDFVPTSMVYENYNACAGRKELYICEGAGHARSYAADPKRYEMVVESFMQKYL